MIKKLDKNLSKFFNVKLHLGHKKNQLNPKMRKFLYISSNYTRKIDIINLHYTQKYLLRACNFVKQATLKNKKFLFIGTKKSVVEIIESQANRCEAFYINYRWVGGILTNWSTIKNRIARLKFLENLEKYDLIKTYPKKDGLKIKRELEKLKKYLKGIENMTKLPDIVFLLDPNGEITARKECQKSRIPIISIVDTNSDPDFVDVMIPGNDDSVQAIEFILKTLVNRICIEKLKIKKKISLSKTVKIKN